MVRRFFPSIFILHLQEFEDLDEIIARHIQPMASFARDIFNFKNYRSSDGGKKEVLDKWLHEEKKKTPMRYKPGNI